MSAHSKVGHGVNLCLVIATLMTGKRTRDQLLHQTGLHRDTLKKHLALLKHMGLAYRAMYVTEREVREDGTRKCGPAPALWAWNKVPFERRDFEHAHSETAQMMEQA